MHKMRVDFHERHKSPTRFAEDSYSKSLKANVNPEENGYHNPATFLRRHGAA